MNRFVRQLNKDSSLTSYNKSGVKKIRISNNISSIDVVGQYDNDIISCLKGFNAKNGICEISPSCFISCINLENVHMENTCSVLGDYAFYGCSSLTSIDCLNPQTSYQMQSIGNSCFERCDGLQSITIDVLGTNRFSKIGERAFANCKNLRDVTWKGAAYVASDMFSGSDNIESINLIGNTSYVYPRGFKDMHGLKEVSIGKNLWFINDQMFSGCNNLTSVNIEDNSYINQIGDFVFEGCNKLHEISIPTSISSFDGISPYFLAGSNISSITFKGIPYEYFTKTVGQKIITKYNTGIWYESKDGSTTNTLNIIKYAIQNNIPVIVILTNGKSCSHCKTYQKNTLKKLKLNPSYFYVKVFYSNSSMFDKIIDYLNKSIPGLEYDKIMYNAWPHTILMWKKKNSTYSLFKCDSSDINKNTETTSKLTSLINKKFNGYIAPEKEHIVIEESRLSLFGLNYNRDKDHLLSCVYKTSDGQTVNVLPENDGTPQYVPEVIVDNYTRNNFKYGIWYYNAKELRQFADRYNIPVLIEYSSEGCNPCEHFKNNYYKDVGFQTWVSKQPYLFCRIEIKSNQTWDNPSLYPQPYYVDSEWVQAGTTSLPIFCWYWKKKDGTIIKDIKSFHFNPNGGIPPFTIEELEKMTNDKFGSYSSVQQFKCPQIDIYNKTDSTNVWYKRYDNQPKQQDYTDFILKWELSVNNWDLLVNTYFTPLSVDLKNSIVYQELSSTELSTNSLISSYILKQISTDYYHGEFDQNGIYFPCEQKQKLTEYVNDLQLSGTDVIRGISVGQIYDSFQSGTYQIYNKTSDSLFRYDKNSIIFKVGDDKRIEYIYKGMNYIDDSTKEPVQFERSKLYIFDSNSSVQDISNLILQAENDGSYHQINIIQSLSSIPAQITNDTFQEYIKNTDEYFCAIVAPDNSYWNRPETPFKVFSDFTNRSYIGQWSLSSSNNIPCIYVYKACRSCVLVESSIKPRKKTIINITNSMTVNDIINAVNNIEEIK